MSEDGQDNAGMKDDRSGQKAFPVQELAGTGAPAKTVGDVAIGVPDDEDGKAHIRENGEYDRIPDVHYDVS
jgi:hypothetical protein